MIHLRDVSRSYGEVRVLGGVSLDVAPGEFVAILGASGSGKSTLLHILGALDAGYTGSARVAGVELASMDDTGRSRFRNAQVGFVFQSYNLVPHLSVLDNVLLPSFFARGVDGHASQRAREALDRVGLADKAHRRPRELSGGERQRVAIARALFARPPLVCADEPTGNLDAATGAGVIDTFARLNREEKVTLVVVTHEDRVSEAASRVLRLSAGKLQ